MNKLEELAEFGRLLYDALQVPVFLVHPGRKIEAEHAPAALRANPFFAAVRDQVAGAEYALVAADQPVRFTRSRLEYLFVNALDDGRLAGTLVLGPFTQERDAGGGMDEGLAALHAGNRRQLLDLYEAVPLLSPERAAAIGLMVHYAVRRKPVDPSASLLAEAPLQEPASAGSRGAEAELSRSRRSGLQHANLPHERVLLHYVRTGEKERMRAFVMEFIVGEEEFGVLARRSRLRSEKNLMITGIALICRAAIEGGLQEETAFTLSDYYIQLLEDQPSLQEVGAVMSKALFDFVDRVAQERRGRFSPAVQDCLHEIASGLYGELTLPRLAERAHLSPNYLSGLFRQEVGLTISAYIQRERIEEAKKLLSLTDYPVADIAAWLSFHDQSYFIKVFKKWEGQTPRAYRRAERRPARRLPQA
ncbi:helix-turn-helix domain-containing protein [Paenibacillus albicereus]|uniref:Helix-turn-helix domain-containing protein n=1 Tax=Paenibacillus albicereus TaxID=2726185 RepID=A0A6H2H3X5_9BACL|nr:helix-turn-helix domain-containing protein [Paenibacillus albicereus]QJC54048.1 helix-turn-helix domain-containing protein [Paenibacillus albicereus]